MRRYKALGVGLISVIALALVVWAALSLPQPAADAQGSASCYRMVGGDKWVCASGGEFELQSGATLDVQAGATTSFAEMTLAKQDRITMSQGGTLTPTGPYQPIGSSGNVQFGAITAGSAGDWLIIVNETNTTIGITETTNLKLSGNQALAQYDAIMLISDGTNWIQLSAQNN